jgi:hypothetical protein
MKKRALAALLVSACLASSWPQLASVEEGTKYGRKIGKRAAMLYFRPTH